MFGRLIGWIGPRWATAAASNWLLIIGISVASIFAIYVQQLRVTVAKCKQVEISQEQYQDLAEKLHERMEQNTDAQIDEIHQATHDCLDVTLGELLSDRDESP